MSHRDRTRAREGSMRPSALELHIGSLVLHGFDAPEREPIGEALRRELAALYRQNGPAAEPREQGRIDAGQFALDPAARPERVGAQIAQAIHGVVQSGGRR